VSASAVQPSSVLSSLRNAFALRHPGKGLTQITIQDIAWSNSYEGFSEPQVHNTAITRLLVAPPVPDILMEDQQDDMQWKPQPSDQAAAPASRAPQAP
jgi:hypothetical protein